MKLYPENIYHIYNRGINRQLIFFNHDNYLFFRRKMKKYLLTNCEIMGYCLMPNHFHFMIYTRDDFKQDEFSEGLKILLSSFAKAINLERKRTGSLFQQNTKAKCLSEVKHYDNNYPLVCLNYIHQNPLVAGLVKQIEDWEYSSFREYIGLRYNKICNIDLVKEMLDLPNSKKELYEISYDLVDKEKIKILF